MKLIINNSSMQPIYEQVVAQIKAMIIDGTLVSGENLPSVRTLSKDLRISALTVKKAYDALEQEGFVITVHGKGTYVADTNANLVKEEQRKKVESKMEDAVRVGRMSGLDDSEIRDIFELIIEEGL